MPFLLALLLLAAPPETLMGGVISVSDAETLRLLVGEEETRIRLAGIDAPEQAQPFGAKAKRTPAKA
jgi:endonuclease YncB( thermonuclease family)